MEDLDSKSHPDMTEVWPPVPPATREAPVAEPGAGAEGVRKAIPRYHRSFPVGPISVASTAAVAAAAATAAAPAVTAAIATTAGTFPACGETRAGTGGFRRAPCTAKRTHEVPVAGLDHERVLRGCPAGVCIRTVEAKRTVEEEVMEIERAHDSLLEERLEKEREWPDELERRGALLEQREEEQDSDCPFAMAIEQQFELTILSPIGRKPSEVESAPHTVAGAERSVYRKGWEQVMRSEFEGHIKWEPSRWWTGYRRDVNL